MATGESVQKQIDELQRHFREVEKEKKNRKKQISEEKEKLIDEQIEDLRRQFRVEEKEEEKKKSVEHFSREEKRLLSKIESKLSVIQFLSNSLESAEKDLKDLEEQLEVIRDCKNM